MRKLMILSLAALCVAGMATMAVAADKPAAKTGKHVMGQKVMGEVTAVDAAAKTVSIKESVKGGSSKDMSFTIADTAKVMVHGKAGSIADIKAGDAVTVKHMLKDGQDWAEEIWVSPPAKATKTTKPAKS